MEPGALCVPGRLSTAEPLPESLSICDFPSSTCSQFCFLGTLQSSPLLPPLSPPTVQAIRSRKPGFPTPGAARLVLCSCSPRFHYSSLPLAPWAVQVTPPPFARPPRTRAILSLISSSKYAPVKLLFSHFWSVSVAFSTFTAWLSPPSGPKLLHPQEKLCVYQAVIPTTPSPAVITVLSVPVNLDS